MLAPIHRPPARAAALLAAALATTCGLGACAAPPREELPHAPRSCARLADAFYRIAEQKNRGLAKEAQIELAKTATRGSGAEETRGHWLHVIELVYRFSDASAYEIGATVLDHCVADARGRALVTTLWPVR